MRGLLSDADAQGMVGDGYSDADIMDVGYRDGTALSSSIRFIRGGSSTRRRARASTHTGR